MTNFFGMRELRFAQSVTNDLKKIPPHERTRIVNKIRYNASLKNPRSVAKPMVNYRFGAWRWRIWDWRVIFDIDDQDRIIIVLIVWHRKDMYQ